MAREGGLQPAGEPEVGGHPSAVSRYVRHAPDQQRRRLRLSDHDCLLTRVRRGLLDDPTTVRTGEELHRDLGRTRLVRRGEGLLEGLVRITLAAAETPEGAPSAIRPAATASPLRVALEVTAAGRCIREAP